MAQTRSASTGHDVRLADLIVRDAKIYSMSDDHAVHKSTAIRDGRIVAVGMESDELNGLSTSGTRVVDASDLTLIPAYYDAHEHLFDAAQNLSLIQPPSIPSAEFRRADGLGIPPSVHCRLATLGRARVG